MHKIGIINPAKVSSSGGLFHYMNSLIQGLRDNSDFEVYVFYDDPEFDTFLPNSDYFKQIRLLRDKGFVKKGIRNLFSLLDLRSPVLGRYRVLNDYHLDLLISYESIIGFHLGIPFISFIGDVMYKYYPDLPEYTFRKRLARHILTKRLTKKSVFTVVDSEACKNDR